MKDFINPVTFYETMVNNEYISKNNNLLIDVLMIANKLGSENVTVNCEYTKKIVLNYLLLQILIKLFYQ